MTEDNKKDDQDPKAEAVEEVKKEAPKKEKRDYSNIKPGMTVRVHERIQETGAKGKKERIQIFEGMVLARRGGNKPEATITVRKIGADKVGVEKIYPLNAPTIAKIVPVKQAKVRRSKLYFLRNYKKRLREKKV